MPRPVQTRQRGLIRQWKLLLALDRARHGLTWEQLRVAADEPVSMRTIYRDIDTLTFAGFPVDVKTGGGRETFSRIQLRRQDWRGWQA
jgi:predicted DNA-binding transcriptional regulator YafY